MWKECLWAGFIWFRMGTIGRAVVNAILIFRGSITYEEFLDYQTNY